VEFVETVAAPVPAAGTAHPARQSSIQGLTLFVAYAGFYLATLAGALAPLPVAANLAFAAVNGIFMAMLFVLGHDCCHGALMPGRSWNTWLGRIAFLPILHSTSLWRIAHNQRHHGRPNLKGFDPVWAPMSLAEYRQAPRWRRFVERVYRGYWGPLFYHHTAIWLPSLLLPLGEGARMQWRRHIRESLFVACGGAMLFAAILFAGHALAPARSPWTTAPLGIVVPYLSWGYFAAISTYLNHTHPSVPWFADEESWRAHDAALRTSVHLKMPIDLLPLYSDVMTHTAHHVDASTPVFLLPEAQARLKAAHGDAVIEYTFGIDAYRRIVRACKLFDFERMCWTDFDGNPTSPRLV
jgi:acyl-lipid omega-6 desaturase (Delta-12 desaturase)